MKNNKYSDFAQDLRILRKEAGMSQKDLAEKSGVSYSSIAKYETGKAKPKIENVRKLLRGLGIRFDDYFFGSIEDIKDGILVTDDEDLIAIREEIDEILDRLSPKYAKKVYEYMLDIDRLNSMDS